MVDVLDRIVLKFIEGDEAQDLIEYALLLAFVALASAAIFVSAGAAINTVWSLPNSRLSAAAVSATS
jgi:Flp pilus assembly pilin Flp